MPPLTQKLRILYLMDIMLQRTDDHHMLDAVQSSKVCNSKRR